MCGIAGILHLDGAPASSGVLKKMTDAIAHRGPDGEGQWVDGPVGLGHRRLAIIDLSEAGHQPMISPDHRYVLSYNGEVYNFQELRTELQAAGYWFQSQTDSEVVLHAFAQWGPECVHRFNGMFAYVIWDRKEKTLHLARDRYGIKPLYYAQWGSTFLFGSEQKAILEHPAARKEIDKKALLEYFTFQNIFTDRTLLENVKLFPAATLGRICSIEDNSTLDLEQYWDYQFEEPESVKDSREYEEELDRLLKQALKRQLVTDVELGSYLSGGMDSGTLTALAAKELPYIKTFTCGFDLSSASGMELGFDEREKAEAMSALYQTEHYEMVLKAGDMERCLPKFAWHLEEPRVGQSYPNYYAAGLASKFVKVVLSGAGGDELFAGYPWRYYRAVVNDDFEHYIDQYYLFWQRLIPNTEIQKVFAPVWEEVKDVWTRDIFRDVFLNHKNELKTPEDYINHSLYFEAKTFLHGLLVVVDKLSMALAPVNNKLQIEIFDLEQFLLDDNLKGILLVDYFGLSNIQPYIDCIKSLRPDILIIIDAVQAFLSIVLSENKYSGADIVITSPRKFLPIPDGGLVIANTDTSISFKANKSNIKINEQNKFPYISRHFAERYIERVLDAPKPKKFNKNVYINIKHV